MQDKMELGTVVIVGAGPGVSLAAARRFGREGYKIALIARRSEALNTYVSELSEQGLIAKGYAADASNEASLTSAFALISTELGAVSVLVYNVAIMRQKLGSATKLEELTSDFVANVGGALVSTQSVLPAMKQAHSGTILFTGGGLALNPYAQYASLGVGKAGIRNLAFSLAQELKPENIHVATVTICGFVKPDTRYDPDKIADRYWDLHTQPKESWETEYVYK